AGPLGGRRRDRRAGAWDLRRLARPGRVPLPDRPGRPKGLRRARRQDGARRGPPRPRHLRRRRPEAVQRPRGPPLQRPLLGLRAGRGLLARERGPGNAHDAVGFSATVLLRGLQAAMNRTLALAYGVVSYLLF